VHADRGEHQAEDQGGLAAEIGGDAAEGEQEPRNEEPDEERETEHTRLCRDRDRRVMRGRRLRLLAAQVLLLRVGVLEAADADPDHRVVNRELEPVRDELRPAAGDAVQLAPVDDRVADVRRADHREHEHPRGQRDQ